MKTYTNFINENINYISEYDVFMEPLTIGVWIECYENARLEYIANKKIGKNVKYCVGHVFGEYHFNDDIYYPITGGLHHAWCVIDDKYISDSTPFKYGIGGDTKYLPEELATKHFKDPIYKCLYFVDEEELKNKLNYFPKNK